MRGSRAAIVKHLQEHGSITSKEAFELYGVTRLAACIFDLRVMGYKIDTLRIEGTTRFGEHTTYAKYVYTGEEVEE